MGQKEVEGSMGKGTSPGGAPSMNAETAATLEAMMSIR